MKKLAILLCLMSTTAFATEMNISTSKTTGNINLTITGPVALKIKNSLTKAPQSAKFMGAGKVNGFVIGKNIFCNAISQNGKILESNCTLSVDVDGNVANTDFTNKGTLSGVATSAATKNGMAISITGKTADQILANMKNVKSSGTMTFTKESNDIRCSKVKEFSGNDSANCQLVIDASGSASSK